MKTTPLQTWFTSWLAEHDTSDLIYKEAAKHQIMFVRDQIGSLLRNSLEAPPQITKVVGAHTSKSVPLPVYEMYLEGAKNDGTIYMRGNFHDWNVSVYASTPAVYDFMGCVQPDLAYFFAQGMDEIHANFATHQRNDFVVSNDNDLYAFIRILAHHFDVKSLK